MSRRGLPARRLLAVTAVTAVLPMAAHASVIETFTWVPDYEQSGGYSQEPTATLQLTLSSWTLTPLSGSGVGPYYASGSDAATANITGFSYNGHGATITLSNVSASGETVTTTAPWQTSSLVTPAADNGEDGYPAPTQGYYLISAFTLSGTVNGEAFMMSTASGGTPGTTLASQIPNSDFTYDNTVEEGGYWELTPASVPLPAALPLLLSGIAGLGVFALRRKFAPI
jgi:hypothetical protein